MIALLAAAALAAQQPRTILFVGNSFTFGANSDAMTYRTGSVTDLNGDGMGGVPALFKRFAQEMDLRYDVSLETAAGQTLKWHLENKRAVIDRRWDAVVLQQYSTLSPDEPGDVTDTIPAARDMAANDWLCRVLADIVDLQVERPENLETTALGVAFLAGLGTGVWSDLHALSRTWKARSQFRSSMDASERAPLVEGWRRAVRQAMAS